MLDELNAVFDTMEFEEDGLILVTGFERDGATATLRFQVRTGVDGETPQAWRVDCRGVEAFAFDGGPAYAAEIVDEDPALWPFNQPHASLYCVRVAPDQADALLGALYRAHAEAVGEAIGALRFGDGLNASNAFPGGAGLVANGPLPLLRAYRQALEAHGIGTSVVGESPPQRWDGRQWIRIPEGIQLLILGDNWVVAESFGVARAE
jgi:hypothetical protein